MSVVAPEMIETNEKRSSSGSMVRALGWLVGIGSLAAGAIFAWEFWFKERVIARGFQVVQPGRIYASGQISRWKIADVIKSRDVQFVIALTAWDREDEHQNAERTACRAAGVPHLTVAQDGSIVALAKAVIAIDHCVREQKPILIHDQSGQHLVPRVLAAYQLLIRKKSPSDVAAFLARHGWSSKSAEEVSKRRAELLRELRRAGVIGNQASETRSSSSHRE